MARDTEHADILARGLSAELQRVLQFHRSGDRRSSEGCSSDDDPRHAIIAGLTSLLRRSLVNHQTNLDRIVNTLDELSASGVRVTGNYREAARAHRLEMDAVERSLQLIERAIHKER